jgi:hypothetical protein
MYCRVVILAAVRTWNLPMYKLVYITLSHNVNIYVVDFIFSGYLLLSLLAVLCDKVRTTLNGTSGLARLAKISKAA